MWYTDFPNEYLQRSLAQRLFNGCLAETSNAQHARILLSIPAQVGAQICSHMHLPDEQCFDLMLGILAVAMVLSLASALPIFKVCRMYQCEHRRPQPPWVPAVRL